MLVLELTDKCPNCRGKLKRVFDSELLIEDEPFVSPSYYKCVNNKCAKVFIKSVETGDFYEP